MIIDSIPKVQASNLDAMMRDAYQKWLNDCMTVCCIMRTTMSDEFSCKFDDAQPKEMLHMLNEFFGTLEDLSSTRHWSSKRGKKRMVHSYHARASKPNQTNQSKTNQS